MSDPLYMYPILSPILSIYEIAILFIILITVYIVIVIVALIRKWINCSIILIF